MDKELLSQAMREMGRRGGKARLTKLTADERRRIALKASKAATKARKERAKKRRETT